MENIVKFKSTVWTVLKKARASDTKALRDFVNQYRTPIKHFIIKNGFSDEDAEDLTQDVFYNIFKDSLLSRIDSANGNFRSLLLKIVKDAIKDRLRMDNAKKRGSDKEIVFLEDLINGDNEFVTSDEKDEEFDRLWLLNLLNLALKKLKEENKLYYDVFVTYVNDGVDYKTIAEKFGRTLDDIKNFIRRSKARIINHIKEEVDIYSSSSQEYKSEVNYLSRFLENI